MNTDMIKLEAWDSTFASFMQRDNGWYYCVSGFNKGGIYFESDDEGPFDSRNQAVDRLYDYLEAYHEMSLYDIAVDRVNEDPELGQYPGIILYDWPEGDEHWRWVITAPTKEIVTWAKAIKAQQDDPA